MKQYLLHPLVVVTFLFLLVFLPGMKPGEKEVKHVGHVKRIVSLSPSITRAIVDLGAEKLLVGVTSYHPRLRKKVAIVGSVVQTNIEKIALLKPDAVFSSQEDNRSETVERLKAIGMRVVVFAKNQNMKAISSMYQQLASIIGKKQFARVKIKKYIEQIENTRYTGKKVKVALFISHQPLMGISSVSFLGNAVRDAGGINVFSLFPVPYPVVSVEHVVALNPDVIISVMHDGVQGIDFFYKTLKDFPQLRALKNQAVFAISPEVSCYYTPGVYANAVSEIAKLLRKAERGGKS